MRNLDATNRKRQPFEPSGREIIIGNDKMGFNIFLTHTLALS